MQITAHRGFDERYPENTVCAARRAAETADAIEVDVRRCGSGELVVSHWDNVELFTDGWGDVDQLSAEELAELSVNGTDCGVPRLTELLDAIPPDVGLNLDLKERGIAEDAVDAVRSVPNDAVVTSLHPDPLWQTGMVDESIPLGFNFDLRPDANFETAEAIGCEYANPHWTLCFATDVVDRAHEAGMEVHPWPVGSRVLAWALKKRGVDGLITTRPLIGSTSQVERRTKPTEVRSGV